MSAATTKSRHSGESRNPAVDVEQWPFDRAAITQSDKGRRMKQRDYLESGAIPVIDQGQEFIGGYTDDQQMAYDDELPVVLFGDHTRAVKFVDQPFAVGADGIKIFRPAEGLLPKYFYYWMKSARLPDRGYGRHYQFLRKLSVPVPHPDEQRCIVAELETQLTRLDASVTALKHVQANLKGYRASVLKAACEGRLVPTEAELARRDGRSYESGAELLSGLQQSKTSSPVSEPHPLPEGWVWCRSDVLFEFVTSGSRGWAKYYSSEGALFLRISNLDHESLRFDLRDIQRVTPPPSAEGTRTRVQSGDLLISITADVGMVAVAPPDIEEAYINQHVALARPVGRINREYVAWYLSAKEGGLKQLLKLQRGATKVGLGLDDIRSVPVPLPPLG